MALQTCHYPSPGPPNNVTVTPLDSTSILMNWIPPMFESYNSSIITDFVVSCHSTADDSLVDKASIVSTVLEYEVHSLQPFSIYSCCVMATTTIGSTPMACQTVQTMEDSK